MRGSIPTPGPTTVRYGGNTSCVEVRNGDDIIILDAGTGLRGLGRSLLKEFKKQPLNLTLLLTHTHWDHIQGLPFFGPIYNPRCRLRILGCEGARKGLVAALTGQMESTYFPVPFDKLPSNIEIEELKDFNFAIGSVLVRAHRANHPGVCVGYRLFAPDGLIAFFPDTEPRTAATTARCWILCATPTCSSSTRNTTRRNTRNTPAGGTAVWTIPWRSRCGRRQTSLSLPPRPGPRRPAHG